MKRLSQSETACKAELTSRFRSARAAVLACALALFTAGGIPVIGQETTGNLTGTVRDPSGAVLPDVTVTLTNLATQQTVSVKSDSAGVFYARELRPGRYSMGLEREGFARAEVPEVIVTVGKTFRVDVTMTVGQVQETIEVTGAAPIIDVTGTSVAQNLAAEEISLLPKGRSFQSLAITAPFVNEGEVEGGYQINGASGAENNFMVDGLSNTSLINGNSRQDAAIEYLQEVNIKTSGIVAEYGGALGGVITATTKSGGNQFHGEGHYYYWGNAISAGPVKRLVLDPADDQTVSYFQDYNPKNNNNEVGGSLGGYLIKNKLYFYTAASPRWQRRERNYLFSNGTEPGTLSQKRLYMSLFNKISFDPHQRVRTNFSWLYTPFYSSGTLPSYNSYANSISSSLEANEAQRTRGFYTPQSGYMANVDLTVSNTSLLSIRGGYFYDNFHDIGVPDQTSVTFQASSIGLPFAIPEDLQLPVGSVNTPRIQTTYQDLVTRAYVQADYSVGFNAMGTHNFKVGVGTQKTVNNVNEAYPNNGYVYIWWDRAYRSVATGETQRGTYGYYEVNNIGTGGSTGANITHLYVQDQWRIHPRVTLSLGLRSERERIPSFRRDIKPYAFEFGFADKMAPRLGASVDVLGNGRLKVYGSWGRYYDWTKYELARGSFGGDYWTVKYRALDTLDVFNLSWDNDPGKNLWSDEEGSVRNRRTPGFDDIDPDIKPMAQDNFNAGIEMELSSKSVLAVRYVHNNLLRTIEDVGSLVNGNETYVYANPGEGLAKEFFTTGLTPVGDNPKAKRVYDGLEISIRRRFGEHWFGSASYVYSRLYGNYAGLANSDEISSPTTNRSSSTAQQSGGSIARPGSNVTRGWDLDELLFDSNGNKGVYGRLATDRPHVFKLYGSYRFDFGAEVGGFFYGGSGTPVSTVVETDNGIPVLVNGRGDQGRTPVLTQTDLMVAHEIAMGSDGDKRLRFEFNMMNLLNQKTARHIYDYLNRERNGSAGMSLANVDLSQGYDYNALLADSPLGLPGALAPQYGLEDIFNDGFSGRLGVKFIF